ncbi:hypothetical protein VKT23_009391 [Stygiomarasmius scandens]|uniref:Uncharacterized protein n=1 Tax=Marasmiellus scandens TaxID=2682957 RepID=A0ABR1JFA9_9AGAR
MRDAKFLENPKELNELGPMRDILGLKFKTNIFKEVPKFLAFYNINGLQSDQ